MIKLDEKHYSLKQLAEMLPNKPTTATLWRWASQGVRGHRLRVVKLGRTFYVPESAIGEFLGAINE